MALPGAERGSCLPRCSRPQSSSAAKSGRLFYLRSSRCNCAPAFPALFTCRSPSSSCPISKGEREQLICGAVEQRVHSAPDDGHPQPLVLLLQPILPNGVAAFREAVVRHEARRGAGLLSQPRRGLCRAHVTAGAGPGQPELHPLPEVGRDALSRGRPGPRRAPSPGPSCGRRRRSGARRRELPGARSSGRPDPQGRRRNPGAPSHLRRPLTCRHLAHPSPPEGPAALRHRRRSP